MVQIPEGAIVVGDATGDAFAYVAGAEENTVYIARKDEAGSNYVVTGYHYTGDVEPQLLADVLQGYYNANPVVFSSETYNPIAELKPIVPDIGFNDDIEPTIDVLEVGALQTSALISNELPKPSSEVETVVDAAIQDAPYQLPEGAGLAHFDNATQRTFYVADGAIFVSQINDSNGVNVLRYDRPGSTQAELMTGELNNIIENPDAISPTELFAASEIVMPTAPEMKSNEVASNYDTVTWKMPTESGLGDWGFDQYKDAFNIATQAAGIGGEDAINQYWWAYYDPNFVTYGTDARGETIKGNVQTMLEISANVTADGLRDAGGPNFETDAEARMWSVNQATAATFAVGNGIRGMADSPRIASTNTMYTFGPYLAATGEAGWDVVSEWYDTGTNVSAADGVGISADQADMIAMLATYNYELQAKNGEVPDIVKPELFYNTVANTEQSSFLSDMNVPMAEWLATLDENDPARQNFDMLMRGEMPEGYEFDAETIGEFGSPQEAALFTAYMEARIGFVADESHADFVYPQGFSTILEEDVRYVLENPDSFPDLYQTLVENEAVRDQVIQVAPDAYVDLLEAQTGIDTSADAVLDTEVQADIQTQIDATQQEAAREKSQEEIDAEIAAMKAAGIDQNAIENEYFEENARDLSTLIAVDEATGRPSLEPEEFVNYLGGVEGYAALTQLLEGELEGLNGVMRTNQPGGEVATASYILPNGVNIQVNYAEGNVDIDDGKKVLSTTVGQLQDYTDYVNEERQVLATQAAAMQAGNTDISASAAAADAQEAASGDGARAAEDRDVAPGFDRSSLPTADMQGNIFLFEQGLNGGYHVWFDGQDVVIENINVSEADPANAVTRYTLEALDASGPEFIDMANAAPEALLRMQQDIILQTFAEDTTSTAIENAYQGNGLVNKNDIALEATLTLNKGQVLTDETVALDGLGGGDHGIGDRNWADVFASARNLDFQPLDEFVFYRTDDSLSGQVTDAAAEIYTGKSVPLTDVGEAARLMQESMQGELQNTLQKLHEESPEAYPDPNAAGYWEGDSNNFKMDAYLADLPEPKSQSMDRISDELAPVINAYEDLVRYVDREMEEARTTDPIDPENAMLLGALFVKYGDAQDVETIRGLLGGDFTPEVEALLGVITNPNEVYSLEELQANVELAEYLDAHGVDIMHPDLTPQLIFDHVKDALVEDSIEAARTTDDMRDAPFAGVAQLFAATAADGQTGEVVETLARDVGESLESIPDEYKTDAFRELMTDALNNPEQFATDFAPVLQEIRTNMQADPDFMTKIANGEATINLPAGFEEHDAAIAYMLMGLKPDTVGNIAESAGITDSGDLMAFWAEFQAGGYAGEIETRALAATQTGEDFDTFNVVLDTLEGFIRADNATFDDLPRMVQIQMIQDALEQEPEAHAAVQDATSIQEMYDALENAGLLTKEFDQELQMQRESIHNAMLVGLTEMGVPRPTNLPPFQTMDEVSAFFASTPVPGLTTEEAIDWYNGQVQNYIADRVYQPLTVEVAGDVAEAADVDREQVEDTVETVANTVQDGIAGLQEMMAMAANPESAGLGMLADGISFVIDNPGLSNDERFAPLNNMQGLLASGVVSPEVTNAAQLVIRTTRNTDDFDTFAPAMVTVLETMQAENADIDISQIVAVGPELIRNMNPGDMDAMLGLLELESLGSLIPEGTVNPILISVLDNADDLSPESKDIVAELVSNITVADDGTVSIADLPSDIEMLPILRDYVRSAQDDPELQAARLAETSQAFAEAKGQMPVELHGIFDSITTAALTDDDPELLGQVAEFAEALSASNDDDPNTEPNFKPQDAFALATTYVTDPVDDFLHMQEVAGNANVEWTKELKDSLREEAGNLGVGNIPDDVFETQASYAQWFEKQQQEIEEQETLEEAAKRLTNERAQELAAAASTMTPDMLQGMEPPMSDFVIGLVAMFAPILEAFGIEGITDGLELMDDVQVFKDPEFADKYMADPEGVKASLLSGINAAGVPFAVDEITSPDGKVSYILNGNDNFELATDANGSAVLENKSTGERHALPTNFNSLSPQGKAVVIANAGLEGADRLNFIYATSKDFQKLSDGGEQVQAALLDPQQVNPDNPLPGLVSLCEQGVIGKGFVLEVAREYYTPEELFELRAAGELTVNGMEYNDTELGYLGGADHMPYIPLDAGVAALLKSDDRFSDELSGVEAGETAFLGHWPANLNERMLMEISTLQLYDDPAAIAAAIRSNPNIPDELASNGTFINAVIAADPAALISAMPTIEEVVAQQEEQAEEQAEEQGEETYDTELDAGAGAGDATEGDDTVEEDRVTVMPPEAGFSRAIANGSFEQAASMFSGVASDPNFTWDNTNPLDRFTITALSQVENIPEADRAAYLETLQTIIHETVENYPNQLGDNATMQATVDGELAVQLRSRTNDFDLPLDITQPPENLAELSQQLGALAPAGSTPPIEEEQNQIPPPLQNNDSNTNGTATDDTMTRTGIDTGFADKFLNSEPISQADIDSMLANWSEASLADRVAFAGIASAALDYIELGDSHHEYLEGLTEAVVTAKSIDTVHEREVDATKLEVTNLLRDLEGPYKNDGFTFRDYSEAQIPLIGELVNQENSFNTIVAMASNLHEHQGRGRAEPYNPIVLADRLQSDSPTSVSGDEVKGVLRNWADAHPADRIAVAAAVMLEKQNLDPSAEPYKEIEDGYFEAISTAMKFAQEEEYEAMKGVLDGIEKDYGVIMAIGDWGPVIGSTSFTDFQEITEKMNDFFPTADPGAGYNAGDIGGPDKIDLQPGDEGFEGADEPEESQTISYEVEEPETTFATTEEVEIVDGDVEDEVGQEYETPGGSISYTPEFDTQPVNQGFGNMAHVETTETTVSEPEVCMLQTEDGRVIELPYERFESTISYFEDMEMEFGFKVEEISMSNCGNFSPSLGMGGMQEDLSQHI